MSRKSVRVIGSLLDSFGCGRLERLDNGGEVLFRISIGQGPPKSLERCVCSMQVDASRFRLFHCVRDVLDHQAHKKVRAEIASCDAACNAFHHRAARNTFGQDGHSFFQVETTSLDQSQGFSEGNCLHCGHEVIDQLHERAAAIRAKVDYLATKHGKHWPRSLDGTGWAADEE